ncbi:hypothetical protein [Akkermansia sp.]|uniref:hypothetical protein n=1 Tax=Akkermansia sp. TaxID=1872421 RepID=UPI0025BC9B7A|nr:hypothetical protein [Akkermansia sp.]MCD8064758.1 hypothetical protein [Akkermansia sp.]
MAESEKPTNKRVGTTKQNQRFKPVFYFLNIIRSYKKWNKIVPQTTNVEMRSFAPLLFLPLNTDRQTFNAVDKTEKALKQKCFKAFIWWSIAGSNR